MLLLRVLVAIIFLGDASFAGNLQPSQEKDPAHKEVRGSGSTTRRPEEKDQKTIDKKITSKDIASKEELPRNLTVRLPITDAQFDALVNKLPLNECLCLRVENASRLSLASLQKLKVCYQEGQMFKSVGEVLDPEEAPSLHLKQLTLLNLFVQKDYAEVMRALAPLFVELGVSGFFDPAWLVEATQLRAINLKEVRNLSVAEISAIIPNLPALKRIIFPEDRL